MIRHRILIGAIILGAALSVRCAQSPAEQSVLMDEGTPLPGDQCATAPAATGYELAETGIPRCYNLASAEQAWREGTIGIELSAGGASLGSYATFSYRLTRKISRAMACTAAPDQPICLGNVAQVNGKIQCTLELELTLENRGEAKGQFLGSASVSGSGQSVTITSSAMPAEIPISAGTNVAAVNCFDDPSVAQLWKTMAQEVESAAKTVQFGVESACDERSCNFASSAAHCQLHPGTGQLPVQCYIAVPEGGDCQPLWYSMTQGGAQPQRACVQGTKCRFTYGFGGHVKSATCERF